MAADATRDAAGAPLTELSGAALAELVASLGGRPFQARQIETWIYGHGAACVDELRNLPAQLRRRLAATGPVLGTRVVHQDLADDGTEKLLIALRDGATVEEVLIPEGARTTLCVSTQVGCPVACVFCASGLFGVKRNLTAGEIVEQFLHARRRLPTGREVTNLVVMGMGEPMLNLGHLLPALERITDPRPRGIGFSPRRVTVSTSGYPERIDQFARSGRPYHLAISLHAADDDLRRRLVPTATADVAALVAAARRYRAQTGREVTFEVVLLADCNDRHADARALVARLKGERCTVNLIPWNRVPEIAGLTEPSAARTARFADWLRQGGLNVTVRRRRGSERAAACGQLRMRPLP